MIIARPMGILRWTAFCAAFAISRIPLWFVIFAAFLLNNTISLHHTIILSITILISRSYVESDIAGGGFAFFSITRLLRGLSSIITICIMYAMLIYVIFPSNQDLAGKITILISALLLPFILHIKPNGAYYNGYYTPLKLRLIINFLWLYVAFIPDSIIFNTAVIIMIYVVEIYNLYFNEPLKNLPNRETMK